MVVITFESDGRVGISRHKGTGESFGCTERRPSDLVAMLPNDVLEEVRAAVDRLVPALSARPRLVQTIGAMVPDDVRLQAQAMADDERVPHYITRRDERWLISPDKPSPGTDDAAVVHPTLRSRVVITRTFIGFFCMQVCAIADATDAEILELCNQENPSGTRLGWNEVHRGLSAVTECDLSPVPCDRHAGRLHITVSW